MHINDTDYSTIVKDVHVDQYFMMSVREDDTGDTKHVLVESSKLEQGVSCYFAYLEKRERLNTRKLLLALLLMLFFF